MAGNDGAGSIYALGLRVSRLNPDGSPMVGANNGYSTTAVVLISHEDQYEDGNEIVQKNGQGQICYSYLAPSTLKRTNVTIQICTPDPELDELLAGGTLLTSGGNTVGLAAPQVGSIVGGNGLAIEAWSMAVVGAAQAPTLPYRRKVFGRVFLKRSARENSDNGLAPEFTGFALENPNFGNGPYNDWPYVSNRVWQEAREAALPTFQVGYIPVPVQT